MAGIPTSNILQPGNISVSGGANRTLVSNLQLLTPQYYKTFVEKYGPENWTWWLATYGGMEQVYNRNFFWFESRGKLQIGIQLASDVTGLSAGSTAACTLAAGFHYNSGTQTPLRVGETVYIASTNVGAEIIAITGTTPNAFTFNLRPKQSTQSLASAGQASTLQATDVLIFGGRTDVGEASGTSDPQVYLTQPYNNNITEFHDTWSATDLGEMTDVYIDTGVSGSPIGGAAQAGTSYFTYMGLTKASQRFVNNVERKLMFGDAVTNTGLGTTTSVGSQGVLPFILANGETVNYSVGNLDIGFLHTMTRVMDVNGCVKQNMWMADIFQRQDFSDGIFTQFPAGSFVWGYGEKSEEASLAYGFKVIDIDGYRFQISKYRNFNSEAYTGLTPVNDYFRNYGFLCPMGETPDAKTPSRVYKNITIMAQQPPKGGSVGNGIRVWNWGGGSTNPTDGTLRDNIEMATYRATRVVAGNQFINIVGS
jgi:hypothetical protein